jgi:hypothetical protein
LIFFVSFVLFVVSIELRHGGLCSFRPNVAVESKKERLFARRKRAGAGAKEYQ